MRMMKPYVALAALLAAPAVEGHHSMAMFDVQQPKVLTGRVVEFQWTNPHCYVQLMVSNASGRDEEWSLEMAAPMYLYNKGWRPSTVKPGDRIKVTIAPLRSGAPGGMLLDASTADGKPIGKSA
jgi:hypothetical protein